MTEYVDLQKIIDLMDQNESPERDIDIDSDDLSLQKQRFENDRYKIDTVSRKKLAYWAAYTVSIYLFFIVLILVFNNLLIHLSDTVLSILLGTTTLNVLGLMYIVLKGYFYVNIKK